MNWGIISTADINRLVIPPAQASPKVDLVGVASRDAGARRRVRREVGHPARATARTRRSSPTRRSRRSTSRCRTRCTPSGRSSRSRPASTSSARSRSRGTRRRSTQAWDAADRAGKLLSEAFMYRHHPQSKRLRALVEEGAIGELRLIRSVFSYSLYDEDNIRLRTDVEGGALMDVGCYCVSRVAARGGRPSRSRSTAPPGSGRPAPTGSSPASMRFPGDVLATFDCGTAMPNRDELEVVGSEGSLFLDDPWHCDEPVIELRHARRQRRPDRGRARELVPARARERDRRRQRRGASCCSAARTRWGRRGRSPRSTARRRRGEPVSL